MYISRYFICYAVIYIIYKIYKNKKIIIDHTCDIDSKFKKNNKNSIIKNLNETKNKSNNEYQIVPFTNNKINQSKYNLSEIYDNFFNGVKKKLKSDFNINDYSIDISRFKCNKKEIVIFNENQNDIILDNSNNFIKFNFDSKKNHSYKIKYKLFSKNEIKNIKLIITGKDKRFVYDFCEHNIIDGNIKDYGFILDNNVFGDDNIHLYIILLDIGNINIQTSIIEIIEKPLNSDNSIIIFDVNSKYYPIYFDEINLLEFSEFNDNNNVFFI